jgi:hypothetical protein
MRGGWACFAGPAWPESVVTTGTGGNTVVCGGVTYNMAAKITRITP